MSLLDLQRALSTILTDGQTRAGFLADKMETLRRFELTPTERAALCGLDANRLSKYSQMLVHNRLDLALKAVPRIRSFLGNEFLVRYASEYAQKFAPGITVGSSPMLTEFKRLIPFLLELSARGDYDTPHFADLVQYESTLFLIGNDPAIAAQVQNFQNTVAWPERIHPDDTPVRSPGVAVRTLSAALWRRDDAQEAPTDAGVVHLVFQKIPGDTLVRMFKVTDGARQLLERCDGKTSLRSIVSEMYPTATAEDVSGAVEKCSKLSTTLLQRKVLGLPSRPINRSRPMRLTRPKPCAASPAL